MGNGAERIKEIEARANKATPGDWKYAYEGSGDFEVWAQGEEIGTAWSKDSHFLGLGRAAEQNEDNAAFIAHARQDIPWLIAELRAALAARDAMEINAQAIAKRSDTWQRRHEQAESALTAARAALLYAKDYIRSDQEGLEAEDAAVAVIDKALASGKGEG